MSGLIWDKGAADVDARIMAFLAGEDVTLDRALFVHDLTASRAHARGLGRAGVLNDQEVNQLCDALDALHEDWRSGAFTLDARYEDGHSAIEAYLTQRLGEVGKKIHTGRSRNDQVLVATRLYMREALNEALGHVKAAASVALDRAEQDPNTPMPGYTHLQRAVPSSTGMWFAGWAEALIDDATLLAFTARWVDANPLGTAAGYGVNVALERDGVSAELGFDRTQINPIYAQNSRGKFELQLLHALGQALLDVRRLAWDLSLFTMEEFAFVTLPDRYTTGSSIMPNKRNPDVVELLRAAYATVSGAASELEQVLSLPSGYHRDLQATKGPLMRGVTRALGALALVPELLEAMRFDAARMRAAINGPMYATDLAVELALSGLPFREAYRQVGVSLDQLDARQPQQSVSARVSGGACADLRLGALRARLGAL